MAIKLGDKIVRGLPTPETGNQIRYDSEVRGFGARVTAGGAKSFILNYRIGGRERRITIGSFPDWTVGQAREQAKVLKRQIDVGQDPLDAREAERDAITIKQLAARYIAEHAKPHKRPRSVIEDERLLAQHIIPELGRLRVASLRRQDVEHLHRKISESTPTRANRTVGLLSTMLNLAVNWEIVDRNPCKGVNLNQEIPREKYLSGSELEHLLAAIAEHPNRTSGNIVKLLLLTGCRKGELLTATWDQINFEDKTWTKPATSTKQRKSHRIPLSAPALQLLSEMCAKSEGPQLFPARRSDSSRDYQCNLYSFFRAVCRSAGIANLRLHDLRHTAASFMAGSGLSLPIIGRFLGHTQPGTTARYAHLADDPLRQAAEAIGRIVAGAENGTGKPKAEVIPLARNR
jgi:integrase